MRRLAVVLLSAATLATAMPRCARSAAVDPPSNVDMLRGLIDQAAHQSTSDMPAPPSGAPVVLRPASSHPSNWLIEQSLAEILAARGIHPKLNPVPDSTAKTPATPADAAVVEYRAVDIALDYVKSRVAVGTGQKYVTRTARATVATRLLAPGSGEVLWARDGSARTQDEVADDVLRSLSQPQVPISTQPTVPVARLTRYTEPLLITVIVGGLISLFYANK